MVEGLAVGDWIERLAQLLPPLAQAQEPCLREYQERYARVIVLRDGEPPPFPLGDLCSLQTGDSEHRRGAGTAAGMERKR